MSTRVQQFMQQKQQGSSRVQEFLQQKQQAPALPQQQPVQQDGFFKSLAKDATTTLAVKPALRTGQALSATSAFVSTKKNEGDRKKLQAQLDDILRQTKTTSGQEKADLQAKARDILATMMGKEQAQGRAIDKTNEAYKDRNINLPGLGTTKIEGQRGGLSGVKQIAGDAAKSASYLYTPVKGGQAVKTGLRSSVIQGAKQSAVVGMVGGALYSGGQAAIEDKSLGTIGKEATIGGATGMVGGAVLGAGGAVVGRGLQKTVGKVGSLIKNTPEERIVNNRLKELNKLESSYAVLRKQVAKAKEKGIDVKKLIAEKDFLVNSVDDTGTIRTQNAIADLNDFIRPQEDVISKNLQKEGKKIPLGMVKQKMKQAVDDSGVKGGAKIRAYKNIEDDIAGYALEADKDGYIPLSVIHDAKVDKYANINYMNPESKRVDKALAKGLKEIVEGQSKSVDVKSLNRELSQYYTMQKFLEALDGRKVDGGKLGKYFKQTIGSIAGSKFGPLGAMAGSEIGGRIHSAQVSGKFGRSIGAEMKPSSLMSEAVEKGKDKVISLPARIKDAYKNSPVSDQGGYFRMFESLPKKAVNPKAKPKSQSALSDTGNAYLNRLNKYETEALKKAKKK